MSDSYSGNREPRAHKDWEGAANVPGVDHEMHELGNMIVALQFCLRQLGGRQGTDELEGVVHTGLEICKQGMATFRKVSKANARDTQPGDDLHARASQYQQRAAEYHAIADQIQGLKARSSYRHLAETYAIMARRLDDHMKWYGREGQKIS